MRTPQIVLCLLAFAACLGAVSQVEAQFVTRQPYLQQGTPESMVIVWRTLPASDSAVRFGTDPNNLDQIVTASDVTEHHEVRITGLQPGQTYYYSVGTTISALSGGTPSHFFRTSPPVGSRDPFRIWVVGDSGTGLPAQFAVRDAMLNFTAETDRPDIYLHMGDMAYSDGETLEFDLRFYSVYEPILRNTVCWPTLGNHEGHSSRSGPQSGPYYEGYALPTRGEAGGVASGTEAYYSFDHGNVHFVVLDSHDSPRETDGAMLTWLRQDLASTDQDWLVAFWHHPPYTKGSHDSDTEGQLIEMRENALPILEEAGVDLVLAGHSHIYERSWLLDGAYDTPTVDLSAIVDNGDGKLDGDGPYRKSGGLVPHEGAVYVVAGHGGTGVKKEGDHPLIYFAEAQNGSCIIDIEGNTLSLKNLRWDGEVSDSFTLVKDEALLLRAPRGGEELGYHEPFEIQWSAFDIDRRITIAFSPDGGESWEIVADGLEGVDSHAWTAPPVDTTMGLVRVSDTDDPSVHSISRPFAIERARGVAAIPINAQWRYYDGDENPGADWMMPGFDDADWPEGGAQLGYGEGDEATVLRDPDPNNPSVLFRKRVVLDGITTDAFFTAIHDDGIAVWVNGQFVYGKLVGDGLGWDDWASDGSDDNEISASGITLSPDNPFEPGENVIAIMVKQKDAGSSDLSFAFLLQLEVESNLPPELMLPEVWRPVEGLPSVFAINVRDPDGDPVVLSVSGLPSGAVFDANAREISWTPGLDQAGTYALTVQASDGVVEVSEEVLVEVADTNGPPELEAIPRRIHRLNETLRLTLVGTDPDGDTLTYSASGLPGLELNATTGELVWDQANVSEGLFVLSAGVSDGALEARQEAEIDVQRTPDPEHGPGDDPEPTPTPTPVPEPNPVPMPEVEEPPVVPEPSPGNGGCGCSVSQPAPVGGAMWVVLAVVGLAWRRLRP